jgi:hypothetical protein
VDFRSSYVYLPDSERILLGFLEGISGRRGVILEGRQGTGRTETFKVKI